MIDLKKKKIGFSLEVFPPKMEEQNPLLVEKINNLDFKPDFISVTYGAGGSTKNRTLDLVKRIHKDTDISVAAHLTCVDSSIDDTMRLVDEYIKLGITKIVALRGDSPNSNTKKYKPHPKGFQKTSDLIRAIKENSTIELFVAGYPEKHPESYNVHSDLINLKEKVNNGADFIITQYFFDNQIFFNFLESMKKYNISSKIIPGIIPITNYQKIKQFSENCGASIPKNVSDLFENTSNKSSDKDKIIQNAISHITEQSLDLIKNDIRNIHIYTLNQISLVNDIWIEIQSKLGTKHE
jgi:methylenetetrahydrofolate reductase (NADPH)